jgi:ketol-acid reductoisomerase
LIEPRRGNPKIIDEHVAKNMRLARANIRQQKFARQFIREMKRGAKTYRALMVESSDPKTDAYSLGEFASLHSG